jgi:hypothetical protein
MIGPSSSHTAGAVKLARLRETGLGGLAATPTGKKLAKNLRESAPKLDERS